MSEFHPEFINYNNVIVSIDGYRVSNTNLRGIPGDKCESHLLSFTVNSPAHESSGTASLCSTGSLSLIDYKYAVFNVLVNHWKKYNNNNNNGSKETVFPYIKLTLNCFTGERNWSGVIKNWELSFNGGAPQIDIEWGAYGISEPHPEPLAPGVYNDPSAMLEYVQKKLNSKIKFVYIYNNKRYVDNEIKNKLTFINGNVLLSTEKFPNCSDLLISFYLFICYNVKTVDGDSVYGVIEEIDNEIAFVCRPSNPEKINDKDKTASLLTQLEFINNGSYRPYSKTESGRYAVPIMNFNFKTNFNNIPLQPTIVLNKNGSVVVGASGCYKTMNSLATKSEIECKSKASDKGQIELSFDCYNVACFANNNTSIQPYVRVFDEFGNEMRFLGGPVTVTNVTYSLEGAVIKASVRCTTVFGNNTPISTSELEIKQEDLESDNNT